MASLTEVNKTIEMYKGLNKSEKYYIVGVMQGILLQKNKIPNKSA